MKVVVTNTPAEAAWAAFDTAAIAFHRMYGAAAGEDTGGARAERMKAGQEVVRLWNEWRRLFLGDEPKGAA